MNHIAVADVTTPGGELRLTSYSGQSRGLLLTSTETFAASSSSQRVRKEVKAMKHLTIALLLALAAFSAAGVAWAEPESGNGGIDTFQQP